MAGEIVSSGPVTISISFDEYNLDAQVTWTGVPLPLPEQRPSEEEIVISPSAMILLGGFLIRGHADEVSSSSSGEFSVLKIHMDH